MNSTRSFPNGENDASKEALKVAFFGTPAFAAAQLSALLEMPSVSVVAVLTQPDRPAGRGQKLVASPVKELAISNSIPCLQPVSLRKEMAAVKEFAKSTGTWDLAIVAAYGLIIPQEVLDLPGCGCINVHASLLPRWRGAAPIHRAILAGDRVTGVGLMRMEAGLDTGPVFINESIEIAADETTGSLHDRLAALGASMLKANLMAIARGEIAPTPQSEAGDKITYANKISKDEALICWNNSAHHIERCIRGFNPTPGAFTVIKSERVKLWKARIALDSPTKIGIGEIRSFESKLFIGCADYTALEILELQPAGRKRISAAEYLRGFSGESTPKTVDLGTGLQG